MLCQFDTLSAQVESSRPVTLASIILGLGVYCSPVNVLSKKKRTMCHGMRDQHSLKMRRYAARFVDLNDFVAMFPGANISYKICVTELNDIFLNSMPSIWSTKLYVQVFDGESITF